MKRIATLFIALAGLIHAQEAKILPNIVYILADDMGYGEVQHLNPKRNKVPTPHIDRLAKEGLYFTDAHSGSSVCTPTRYGLLTGRYAWRTRLQRSVLSGYDKPLITADRLTVPKLLGQHGYHTACFGKWHLGFTLEDGKKIQKGKFMGAPIGAVTKNGPTTRGFDEYFGFHHSRIMKSVFENDRCTQLIEPIDMLGELAKRSREFIHEHAKTKKPFFLYLALSSPHTPIVPSKAWQGKSGLSAHADLVMETDWVVGEVTAALDEAGISNNTLVVFTSDNGTSAKPSEAKRAEAAGHFASAHFRGYKSDIWDGGHRVPFIVRWPNEVKAGSQTSHPSCLTDLLATCADLVGTTLPDNAGEDSLNILPVIKGKADKAKLHQAIIHHSIKGRFSVRKGPWKLILCPGSGGWSQPNGKAAIKKELPPIQLYQMVDDPSETENLYQKHPEKVKELNAILETFVANGRSTEGAAQQNDAPVKTRSPL